MYRIHERGWRKVIDLAICDVFYLQDVYVENLTFQHNIRLFWNLVTDNHDRILKMVHQSLRHNQSITLRHLTC